jgi:hypothetical protein
MAVDDRGVVLPVLPGAALLAIVFRDMNMEFAMAVGEISEPTAMRYGVVAFRTTVMIHVSRHQAERHQAEPEDEDGYAGDWGLRGKRELKLQEKRGRKPLSAAGDMAKFRYEPCDELVNKLSEIGTY